MFNGLVEDWFDDGLQIGYERFVAQRRIGLPTVRLEADFRGVSRFGDKVKLALAVERVGERSLTLQLQCLGAGGDLRMQMRQVLVTTSLASHQAIAIPSDLREALHGAPQAATS
jgi:4-hydroxybenzoyl-CoA thioesterase